MKIFLLILLFSFSAYAQSSCPTVTTNKGKITKAVNFNSSFKTDSTCRVETYVGTITALSFADDGDTEPIAITLQLKSKGRVFIALDESTKECFSEVEKASWTKQLKKNARVKITVFRCGQSADSDLQISSIIFL